MATGIFNSSPIEKNLQLCCWRHLSQFGKKWENLEKVSKIMGCLEHPNIYHIIYGHTCILTHICNTHTHTHAHTHTHIDVADTVMLTMCKIDNNKKNTQYNPTAPFINF